MKIIVVFSVLIIVIASTPCLSEPGLEGRNLVELENGNAKVIVDLGGGSIVDFHIKGHGLNPLNWNYPENGDTEPRRIGHFICFDRWGQPSPAEEKNGMPFHGEATKINWRLTGKPVKKAGRIMTEMSCELPMAGLRLDRKLSLDEEEAVLTVTEEISNFNKLGRVYNFVQHATFAPPFLDESVLVDTEVKKGLTQRGEMPHPEEPVIYWPKAVFEGRLVDFRRLKDDIGPGVISFVFNNNDEYAWATACNPPEGLLIGYVWKTADYPWLNLWYHVQDGKPSARGIEFGTTGLHQPFPILVKKGEIFGRYLFEYIDADEKIVKSYTAFLAEIPKNYKGVADIEFDDGLITLLEHKSDSSRNIFIKIK